MSLSLADEDDGDWEEDYAVVGDDENRGLA